MFRTLCVIFIMVLLSACGSSGGGSNSSPHPLNDLNANFSTISTDISTVESFCESTDVFLDLRSSYLNVVESTGLSLLDPEVEQFNTSYS